MPFFLPPKRSQRWRLLALLLIFAGLAYANRAQCAFLLSRLPVIYYYLRYAPEEGDIVFQSLPHGDLVDAIEGITHSPYSHCGMVIRNDQQQWVVIESILNVHETSLFLWMLRGRGGNFTVCRLDAAYTSLIPKFKEHLLAYKGYPYDFDYDLSNPHAVYCSDLAYLAFEQTSGEKLGKLEKLGDLDWKPFQPFIESVQGGALPLNRIMITPASLARAPQLHEIYRTGLY